MGFSQGNHGEASLEAIQGKKQSKNAPKRDGKQRAFRCYFGRGESDRDTRRQPLHRGAYGSKTESAFSPLTLSPIIKTVMPSQKENSSYLSI